MGKIPKMPNSCPKPRSNKEKRTKREKKSVEVDALGKNDCVEKENSGRG